mmetsp:Transcript_39620/g.112357  ORF Transcript_39620/g.112357 Transcript_39620/m.112357 type:complete len:231 (-) Transcript_39620:2567-3259(-)
MVWEKAGEVRAALPEISGKDRRRRLLRNISKGLRYGRLPLLSEVPAGSGRRPCRSCSAPIPAAAGCCEGRQLSRASSRHCRPPVPGVAARAANRRRLPLGPTKRPKLAASSCPCFLVAAPAATAAALALGLLLSTMRMGAASLPVAAGRPAACFGSAFLGWPLPTASAPLGAGAAGASATGDSSMGTSSSCCRPPSASLHALGSRVCGRCCSFVFWAGAVSGCGWGRDAG